MSVRVWRPHCIPPVLSGDVHPLWDAFKWTDSPQGWTYWHRRAKGLVPLSDDDRAYLQRLYAAAVSKRLGVRS